jgi:hypothetical protein
MGTRSASKAFLDLLNETTGIQVTVDPVEPAKWKESTIRKLNEESDVDPWADGIEACRNIQWILISSAL